MMSNMKTSPIVRGAVMVLQDAGWSVVRVGAVWSACARGAVAKLYRDDKLIRLARLVEQAS